MLHTDNLRVAETAPVPSPNTVRAALPMTERAAATVTRARQEIEAVIDGRDRRLLVIVGPCSIHDPTSAREYAQRLASLRDQLQDDLLICMRTYFEKPRTTIGWKGLINDPHLDGSYDVAAGLRLARTLLLELAELGMPTATEMLDPVVPQYIAELISWSAIGARTTESQTHREMASGLSMPVGFKNGTDGSLSVAINAMRSAQAPHSFLGVNADGQVAVIRTRGNHASHVVLRGAANGPNYSAQHIQRAQKQLHDAGLRHQLMVDCSHANSGKDETNQPHVVDALCAQWTPEHQPLLGIMLESHLVAGRQDLNGPSSRLRYGQSITDACIDIDTTERTLKRLALAVTQSKRRPAIDAPMPLV